MDVGVGSFVFSLGVVSTKSFATDASSSSIQRLARSMYKSIPLILLGLVRVVTVKGSEYPVSHPLNETPSILISVGACHRVWGPLEFLLYARPTAGIWCGTVATEAFNDAVERYCRSPSPR